MTTPSPDVQGGRGGSPAGGRGWEEGPSFTPGRAPAPRDGGPNGPRPQRGGPGRPAQKADGYDRRGPRSDDFAGGLPVWRGPGGGPRRVREVTCSVSTASGPAARPAGLAGCRRGPRCSCSSVGTALGIIVTLVAGQEPGGLLGFFIIVGTIAAALCIRRGKVYLIFPAPALAFFVAAVVTGKVHDAKLGSSTAGLASGFTQWVAGMFFPAVVATIIVVLIGGGRWLLGRQLISGQSPLTAGGRPAAGNPRPGPRDRRPAVDSWVDDNSFDSFDNPVPRTSPTGPTPRQGGTGPTPRPGGTGPTPRQGGTGPAPQQGNAPRPGGTGPAPRPSGTGPSPRQGGSGPNPRQGGTGPAPQQGNAPRPGGAPNGNRPPRPSRDPRSNRDPWVTPPSARSANGTSPARERPGPSGSPAPRPPRPPLLEPQPKPGPPAPAPPPAPRGLEPALTAAT